MCRGIQEETYDSDEPDLGPTRPPRGPEPDEVELPVTVPLIALRATETNLQIPQAVRMMMTKMETRAATTLFRVVRLSRGTR